MKTFKMITADSQLKNALKQSRDIFLYHHYNVIYVKGPQTTKPASRLKSMGIVTFMMSSYA